MEGKGIFAVLIAPLCYFIKRCQHDEPDSKPLNIQIVHTPSTPVSDVSDEINIRSPVFVNSPRDFLHFDYTGINNIKSLNENYYKDISVPPVHQDNGDTAFAKETYDENYVNMKRISGRNSFNQKVYQEPMIKAPSILKSPLQELDYNPLEGQTPIYVNPYGHGLIPKPSVKGVVRTDSLSSNRELIHELRQRQSKMKTPDMKKADNPYKECSNLEEILQVHSTIIVKN